MNTTHSAINNIAKINNHHIQVISDNGQKLVPIKPICEILNVDYPTQFQKLKDDEILSSVVTLTVITGADGKKREATSIPLMFVFGWLFKINPDKVKPEARENFIRFQKECYMVLWKHFSGHAEYVEYRQEKIDQQLAVVDQRRKEFNQCKKHLAEAQHELNRWREFTFDHYKFEKNQHVIEFPEAQEAE